MTKSMWYKVRWSFRLYVFICKREPYSVTKTVTWFGGVLCTNRIGRMLACTCSIAQLCLTLCDPVDCSLPGSSVPEVFHARILQWVAISFSSGSSPLRDWSHISCIVRQILYHCATWEALYALSKFQLCNTMLLTVTMLNIRCSDFIHLTRIHLSTLVSMCSFFFFFRFHI